MSMPRKLKRGVAVASTAAAAMLSAAVKKVADRKYGKFIAGHGARLSNLAPSGIGKCPDSPIPAGFDWDKWIGPRPYRPYRYTTAPYYFRWHEEFSSQMVNWGVHYCDVMRWILDEEYPCAITAVGGTYCSITMAIDTLELTLRFAEQRRIHFCGFRKVRLAGHSKARLESPVLRRIYARKAYDIEEGFRIINKERNRRSPIGKQRAIARGVGRLDAQSSCAILLEVVKDRANRLCTSEDR